MGAGGVDVQLSEKARRLFPYSVECKNRQTFGTLYEYFETAAGHDSLEPLLVVKMNHKQPLVVITLEHFMHLQQGMKNVRNGQ